jgi:hypothetical protein
VELDATAWSGEGAFTKALIDALKQLPAVRFLKVEDAPASRENASFSFICNEIFVAFGGPSAAAPMTLAGLQAALEELAAVGAPDYADDGMLQYLRTERIIPPYQTRGYKLIELVRIYEAKTR